MAAKRAPNLSELIGRFETANKTSGKSQDTIDWYNQILKAFDKYLLEYHHGEAFCLFTVDIARGYVLYLQTRPKFQGHPFTPARGKGLSVEAIRGHLRALKAFSTWINEEGYSRTNVLQKMKMLKAPKLIIEPLTAQEIPIVLKSIGRKTITAQRNYAVVSLMIDTGIREGEVAGSQLEDFTISEGCLKVLGKGDKERVVPIGKFVQNLLVEYINSGRAASNKLGSSNLFLAENGKALTSNALKLFFSDLAKNSGILRLHAHLLRHTFAINYLLNGGDIFSLKEILGHTSLEMVNRYLHFTKAQITARQNQFSPMDRMSRDLKIEKWNNP